MKEIKKVLFPVDFSEVSPKIVPWALTIAKKFNAEIHLLFVVRRMEYFTGIYVSQVSIADFEDEVLKGAEKKIVEFADKYFSGYPVCKSNVIVGDAVEEIIRYIKSGGIDMVLIGTHGRNPIERIFFGSVARGVIKKSPVPVMTVNPNLVSEI
ncbi:MAG: universal stress protein [Deltaproteobacteria bacterium]|nr:universal stress protein [Deltaproteobacteria bacterium]